jgi:hypothetical protein
MPKLDGQYLFRDYETTLHYVKIACDNTARQKAPLHALWLLSEKMEDLASLLEGDLNMSATAALAAVVPVPLSNRIRPKPSPYEI